MAQQFEWNSQGEPQMTELIIFLVLIILGYLIGTIAESRHYKSIKAREYELLNLPAVTIAAAVDPQYPVKQSQLVTGSVVISVDYFKRFVAGLRNFFGGKVVTYESLVDRARREAILRMKAQASGANIILNMRIETASISKGAKNTIGSIEALAYGTAITYGNSSSAEETNPQ
jgi:uncharacterized protein YbjQ (UPF0145 family)